MSLCRKPDQFLEDKTSWIAYLSDGSKVYQDDYRPGEEIESAWARLKKFTDENDLKIKNIKIRFRSHTLEVPTSGEYHFKKGVGCFVGMQEDHFYIFGVKRRSPDGKEYIKRIWYKVPELVITKKSVLKDEEMKKFIENEHGLIIGGVSDG